MNGMLQHQELFDQEIRRHQQQAHEWARVGAMGRIAVGLGAQARLHPRRTRLLAVASPMAVALGLLASIS